MASDTQTLLHFASLTDVARRLERKELSPVDLTRTMLERIETVDARLKSYATVTAERALDAARAAEAEINGGRYRGPLHGMPVAVKDLCFTRGIPTMAGMAIRKDFVPDRNATVIERLDAAGAVLLGKLALTEGAMVGYHREFDVPVNPWESDLWPGASSSGSGVATAAGLCFASLGSDTGGSIRFPSLANGIVGLKPTYGRVSRHGVLDLGETLDHVGPMTRGVEDAAIVLAAIAGRDPADPTSSSEPVPTFADLADGVRGLTLGYDANYATDGTDAELVASIEAALESGHRRALVPHLYVRGAQGPRRVLPRARRGVRRVLPRLPPDRRGHQ
jgi:amidase